MCTMYKFNKKTVRDTFKQLCDDGLYMTIANVKRTIINIEVTKKAHQHTLPSYRNMLLFLENLEKDYLFIFERESVIPGIVLNDLYVKDNYINELKFMFNKLQKETDYGVYIEL